jgi:hypothetical protein
METIFGVMKMPPNAIPDKFTYSFIYENGIKKEFSADQLPDSTGICRP